MTRRRPIASAVVRCAKMRAALQNLARNADVRLTWIKARAFRSSAGVLRNTAGLRCLRLVVRGPPVERPFPDVADHVIEAIAVRRKSRHRRRALKSVFAEVLRRKIPLPGISHVLAVWRQLIAPGELFAIEPAARG